VASIGLVDEGSLGHFEFLFIDAILDRLVHSLGILFGSDLDRHELAYVDVHAVPFLSRATQFAPASTLFVPAPAFG